jgi:hypothetical protein
MVHVWIKTTFLQLPIVINRSILLITDDCFEGMANVRLMPINDRLQLDISLISPGVF